jgi:hypothetical protein
MAIHLLPPSRPRVIRWTDPPHAGVLPPLARIEDLLSEAWARHDEIRLAVSCACTSDQAEALWDACRQLETDLHALTDLAGRRVHQLQTEEDL